jgi:hypothetical protein
MSCRNALRMRVPSSGVLLCTIAQITVMGLLLVLRMTTQYGCPLQLHDTSEEMYRVKRAPETRPWSAAPAAKDSCDFLNGTEVVVFLHTWPRNSWRFILDDIVSTLQASPLSACGVSTHVGFPADDVRGRTRASTR